MSPLFFLGATTGLGMQDQGFGDATMPQRHFLTMESPKTAERKSDLATVSSLSAYRDKAQFQCRATRRPRRGTCDGGLIMFFSGRAEQVVVTGIESG